MKNYYCLLILLSIIGGCSSKKKVENETSDSTANVIKQQKLDSAQLNPVLPEITQEGKNTLGCIVDSAVWVPYAQVKAVCTRNTYGDFYIDARRNLFGNETRLNIIIDTTLVAEKEYFSQNISYLEYYPKFPFVAENRYTALYTMPGKLVLTKIDTAAKVFSGLFSFTAVNLLKQDTIEIKDGRFDFTFDYCAK